MKTPTPFIAVIATLLVLTFVLLIPLWQPGFPDTDDGTWMIIRLSAFYQSLAEGQFPVRFLGRLNHSYGYPVANFLYPGFLYLGSVLHVLGLSYVDSVKAIVSVSLAGIGICTYVWLRKMFRDRDSIPAVIGLLAYPYILFDIYVRGSVGEVLALFASSLVLASLAYDRVYLAGLAVAFLVLSHNTLAILFLFCLSVIIIITRRWLWIRSLVAGLLMSLFFWFPAILERKYVAFDSVVISNPNSYFAVGKLLNLLPIPLVLALISVPVIGKRQKIPPALYAYFLICLASFFFALPISNVAWQNRILSGLVQFPYRFLAITGLFGAWVVAWVFSKLSSSQLRAVLPLYVAAVIVQAAIFLTGVSITKHNETYYSTNEATTTVADEYMPKWVHSIPEARTSSKLITVDGSAQITIVRISSQVIDARVQAAEDSVIQMNTVYYPGWGVTVDNVLQPVRYDNPYGFIQVNIPSGEHSLHAEFRETGPRFLADIFSVITFVIFSFLSLLGYRKKRRKQ
jgi:hypothetical protein